MKKSLSRFIVIVLCFALVMTLGATVAFAEDDTVIDGYADYEAPVVEEQAEDTEETFGDKVAKVNGAVNSFAWGPVMLVLLVGTGIIFTVATKGFQFAKFGHVIRNTVGKLFKKGKKEKAADGSITPFQALTTAMAATVGTGNIAGVTGAIVLGGPGAIFWMWISALFGMMTKFSEIVLAVKFREKNAKGEWVGGPMYYIKNGLGKNWKWLGIIFSVLGALAAFGIGNMTQVNTIAGTIVNAANSITATNIAGTQTEVIIRWVVGILIAVISALVVIGGVKRIGKVTEKLVPFMSLFYILGALVIIFANIGSIGTVFGSIFKAAFAPRAVVGGVGGFLLMNAIKRGVGRGVFSNEAGLGSSPIAHASTSETHPVKQGLYGIFEVFMDTIVVCTLTAVVVLIAGASGSMTIPWGNADAAGADVTTAAFSTIFGPQFASIFVAVAILCFALSTILSWELYGERCFGFITNGKGLRIYQIIFLLVIVVGATMNLSLVWDIADTLNGLMALPNLVALLALSGVVVKEVRAYKADIRNGIIEK